MQLTPEIKAQLAEQKKQCIFCKLIAGEIEAKTVFQDDVTIAMLDINPIIKGHTLFMLKEHYPIMPYIPAGEFTHYFGLVPALTHAIKEGILSTGINVFIANGGPAGQRAPHFLIHFLPRENGDGFFNFMFKKNASLEEENIKILANNFPIMMNNHFQRNPASWHTGKGNVPSYLTGIYESTTVVYEDEKVLCVIPHKGAAPGHIEIYSKIEEKNIEKLSVDDSAHLFYTASFAATLVFEGLKVHGTNIILKSGTSDDNPQGKLCIHVLPRMQNDNLQNIVWEPKQPKYDLNSVASKIKDKTWKIKYTEETKVSPIVKPSVIQIKEITPKSTFDEIQKAIKEIQKD
ncbi:hypothetical protein COV17_01135 [Candidatus Woesearchaeota archaeon CG10_big_fil_rev_8_21_14_0_10_36_11]|nr:MAG: hypothetical protein COV17_01135 [Candidatus Woesearchaeota archaeon CG10_big_fil_rev_8_21_14_0_10_36_11]